MNQVAESLMGWKPEDLMSIKLARHTRLTASHLYFYQVVRNLVNLDPRKDIIEIGGGYGGLARIFGLLSPNGFKKYQIIDLPFVGQLQQYFLSSELSCLNKFCYIDARLIDSIAIDTRPQLLIATHSLSELSPDLIVKYLNKIVKMSDNVFLSMQLRFHINRYDVSWLLKKLMDEYHIKHFTVTEGMSVVNVLFSRDQNL